MKNDDASFTLILARISSLCFVPQIPHLYSYPSMKTFTPVHCC